VLIDSRLSPQRLDLEFLHWMVGCGLPFILAFTKTDKLSNSAVQKNIETFLLQFREISEEVPAYVLSSSKVDLGRSEILALIDSALTEKSETPA
jgi:GTP-binding protein